MAVREIEIVFDGPPGPGGGRFVEIEQGGASVRLGEWRQRADGLWALVLSGLSAAPATSAPAIRWSALRLEIQARRRAAKLSQAEAAKRAGLTVRAWQIYERGEREPRWGDGLCMMVAAGMLEELIAPHHEEI